MKLLLDLVLKNYPRQSDALTETQIRRIKTQKAERDYFLQQKLENAQWNTSVKRRNQRFATTGLNRADRIAAGLQ